MRLDLAHYHAPFQQGSSSLGGKTPFVMMLGKEANLSTLRAIGARAFVQIEHYQMNFDDTFWEGKHCDYVWYSKNYPLDTHKVVKSRNVDNAQNKSRAGPEAQDEISDLVRKAQKHNVRLQTQLDRTRANAGLLGSHRLNRCRTPRLSRNNPNQRQRNLSQWTSQLPLLCRRQHQSWRLPASIPTTTRPANLTGRIKRCTVSFELKAYFRSIHKVKVFLGTVQYVPLNIYSKLA